MQLIAVRSSLVRKSISSYVTPFHLIGQNYSPVILAVLIIVVPVLTNSILVLSPAAAETPNTPATLCSLTANATAGHN